MGHGEAVSSTTLNELCLILNCNVQDILRFDAAPEGLEEIDLRSVGWGNIFQLPFKHVRDFRLRHLVPFFIYSGFEVLFACTGFALVRTDKMSG